MAGSSSSSGETINLYREEIPSEYCIGKIRETPQGSRSWTPVVDVKPAEKMVFDDLEQTLVFYKEYANKDGFEVRKFAQTRVKGNSRIKIKWFVCSREGLKPNKDVNTLVDTRHAYMKQIAGVDTPCDTDVPPKSETNDASQSKTNVTEPKKRKQTRERPSQRVGCEACIRLEINKDGKYVVFLFKEEHNHSLVHPEYRVHLKSQRKLDFGQKQLLHKLRDAGIGPCVGHRVLTKIHGGIEKVGATSVDAKNYKRDVNAFIGGADVQMAIDMLTKKKRILPDFSFNHFTVNGGELGGLFWADEHAKRNYLAIRDVVSFDATFRSNKYDMVFIPFTGIDNHNRCVTFGAGLLTKEDIMSYDWLLEKFKRAFPREPMIVLTDQDPAMKQAIKAQFVSARHRLCMWHIMEKVTSKIGTSICNAGFKSQLSKIVWTDKLEPKVFVDYWFQVLKNFELQEHKWLSDMFNLKEVWIPAYFRDWNMSGLMRTSSRSEIENHMFGLLMSSSSTLVEFFTFYDTAMQVQRFTQSKNDHESAYTTPDTKTDVPLEKEAANLFTRTIFFKVQKEITAAVMHCYSLGVVDEEDLKKYTIVDSSVNSTKIDETIDREANPNQFDELIPTHSEVSYNHAAGDVFCSCKYFERFGLLCRHIFYVLRIHKVKEFPQKYVCSRWRRDVVPPKNTHCGVNLDSLGGQKDNVAANMREIYLNVDKSVNRLITDPERLTKFLECQKKLFEDIQAELGPQPKISTNEFIGAMLGVKQPANIDVHPPTGVRNKGSRRKRVRLTSVREENISNPEKHPRKCSYCKVLTIDQDSRNCPVKKQDKLDAAAAAAAAATHSSTPAASTVSDTRPRRSRA